MMTVSCSQANSLLLQDSALQQLLPKELVETIQTSHGSQYLDAVASAAVISGCAERVFGLYKPLLTDLANRLVHSGRSISIPRHIEILSALTRILPFAVYLKPLVKVFLGSGQLQTLLFTKLASTSSLSNSEAASLLLSLFRLLSIDLEAFQDDVKPTFLSFFLSHDDHSVRYLAVQCLCMVMHFADALSEKLVEQHIGAGPIRGLWEGKEIDFRILKLLEERRWTDLTHLFDSNLDQSDGNDELPLLDTKDFVEELDWSPSTANFSGVLVPRNGPLQTSATTFVKTQAAIQTMRKLGDALLKPKPILLKGPTGSGKTSSIMEAARLVNQESVLTLHLNDQTDAKSLIGLYTSSSTGDSFEWQPGVLTKALQQGRWVLIEDIDRAPSEVLGVLKPLLEDNSLFLPTRKEKVKPATGFRIFATVKSSSSSNNAGRVSWLTNDRLWTSVFTRDYEQTEIGDLLEARYPLIKSFLPELIEAHARVCAAYREDKSLRSLQSRLPTLRDLMKWCKRVAQRSSKYQSSHQSGTLPESVKGDIFQDAVDCYAAHHHDHLAMETICQNLAQPLNISPQQMEYLLGSAAVAVGENQSSVSIGRTALPRNINSRSSQRQRESFAMTSLAKSTLNSVAAAVGASEPLLLVGETGVGKTTSIQHLARLVGQRLTVVNLSQQSEASDLLGGLKPINTRVLIVPLMDHFNPLFNDTFSVKRNEKFQLAVEKTFRKQNWSRLLLLWLEAIKMAQKALKQPTTGTSEPELPNQSAKRRKVDSKYENLRERWTAFKSKVDHVRAQVEHGDKSHTFAFVEGRLVEAVRNGEWLLLDEINLAATDTLDHIVSLLRDGGDAKPSLLLTEAGNMEQVVAHPSFRVFAAMNPATDTGKKDLSPGIRGRFTELFVQSGDGKIDDLVQIIESYLGNILNSDRRAAHDLARGYLELKALNNQHKLTDGAGDVPHFSIRSLVRCLLYTIQHASTYGLRRAIYEGFAMSFFTVLSRESETLALPAINGCILSGVKNHKSFLSQKPKLSIDGNQFVAFQHHLVRRGPHGSDLQPHYIRTPSVERNLMNLARASSMRRFPILLQGPTSAGKTSMVEYLAKLSGNKFVRINNHEHTDLEEYLGSYSTGDDGKIEFREGVLVEALRQGHWIVLDELNLAPTDVLEALNRLLDDNRELLIPESQEVVKPHPNFMLFATQNPAGLYGGRKRLSRAFRNRFLELHFDDIPEDELEIILQRRSQIPPSFCTQIVQVYKKLSFQRQATKLFEQKNSFATLRDLFRWAARPMDDRTQLAQQGFMLLAERVRSNTEREIVKQTIEQIMKVVIDENELYGLRKIPEALLGSSVVWTPAMIRLFVLVSEALQNNEPVLLVGETGCGKTQICQTVSEGFSRNLSIYNAHANTETGDLIGSQRPVRSRAELTAALLDSFSRLSDANFDLATMSDIEVEDLILQFNRMDPSSLDPEAVARTKRSIGAYQSLFAWNDGSLVRSMKAGEHFLLDEISLADDSVLERLNSVLEPSRTILLAEKGPIDNLVVAHPNFQFLATMNPGGDYGKRELSAALRNRLTEIWVPPLSREDDILPILEASLGADLKSLAPLLLRFATWFKATWQNSTASALPLRSLLSWTHFLRRNQQLSRESAFVHGAALVYVDSLGANPAGLMATGSDVESSRRSCLAKLQSLIKVDAMALYNEVPHLQISSNTFSIGDFSLPRGIDSASPDLVFDASTTLSNTMRIVRALQMPRPILLEGSPGVGKTAIVTALARILGKSFTRINLSDQTDLMDLFGADTPAENEKLGHFSWQDGPLLQAMRTGGWVLLDEMNLASQSVLEGLNSCLDHRQEVYIAELDRSFFCHPDFVLFAAQNPHHQGGGRKGLPSSFVNRFTIVFADPFRSDDLIHISQKSRPKMILSNINSIVQAITSVQDTVARSPALATGGPWEFNLRDVMRWLDLCQAYPGLSPGVHFDGLITNRFRDLRSRTILSGVRDQIFGKLPAQSLYHQLSVDCLRLGTSSLSRGMNLQHVQTRFKLPCDHLSVAKSMIVALRSHWPILLTGPSGCGKTELIRTIAALKGARLVEFSMNADIDTMDLVGGFEQHDIRRDHLAFQSEALDHLLNLICTASIQEKSARRDSVYLFQNLIEAYETCCQPGLDLETLINLVDSLASSFPLFSELNDKHKALKTSQQRLGPRFVWNDGLLIDALRTGAWLVLDNANLCNPSVLDRLNSLLEPDGSLIISEQHASDQKDRLVKPHPNFRLFLTTDPRFGELSRAMRNRSLELFVHPPPEPAMNCGLPIYPTVASIHALREVVALQDECSTADSIEARLEILPISQQDLLTDQCQNIMSWKWQDEFQFQISAWKSIPSVLQAEISRYYNHELEVLEIMQQIPPQLPAADEPLNTMSSTQTSFECWNRRILLHLRTQKLLQLLRRVKFEGEELDLQSKTVLQRSISPIRSLRGAKVRRSIAAYDFLFSILNKIAAGSTEPWTPFQQSLVNFVSDLFNFFDKREIDHAVLRQYERIGKELVNTATKLDHGLANVLSQGIALFRVESQAQTGRGFQVMWQYWKPILPSTWEQLRVQQSMLALLVKFDQLSTQMLHPRSELAVIRLRLIIELQNSLNSPASKTMLEKFAITIDDLAAQTSHKQPVQGQFTRTFKWLFRNLACAPRRTTDLELQKLILLGKAGSSWSRMDFESSLSRALTSLCFLSHGIKDGVKEIATFSPGEASRSLVVQTSDIKHASIRNLAGIQEELSELLRILCTSASSLETQALSTVENGVFEIIRGILLPHKDLLSVHAVECLVDPDHVQFQRRLTSIDLLSNDLKSHEYLKEIISKYIQPAQKQMLQSTTAGLGLALVQVCFAALELFVPDQIFDPAIYPVLVGKRQVLRIGELKSQIQAHQQFQRQLTGQDTSFLIRMYGKDLESLGEVIPPPVILRPEKSELGLIQAVFVNIITGVIQNPDVHDVATSNRTLSSSQMNQVNSIFSTLAERLSRFHAAYDDIVKPISQLLESLHLGLEIVQHARITGRAQSKDDQLEFVPLLGGSPLQVMMGPIQRSGYTEMSVASAERFFEYLNVQSAMTSIKEEAKSAQIWDLLKLLNMFYAEWKGRLTRDQAEAEARSRYYTYRGADDNSFEVDQHELSTLFPTFEDEEIGTATKSREMPSVQAYDSRATAISLASLHTAFFEPPADGCNLEAYILNALRAWAQVSPEGLQAEKRISEVLPGLILELDHAHRTISTQESPDKFNIYTDTNIAEVRSILALIRDIQARFEAISAQWPEHAVPIETLNYCEEFLNFQIQEPIAKLLTKTEKLLEIVARWQSVASREWSVTNLVEALTSKIVHWRRMELLSWSKLLDIEQTKNEQDASAWYFIAYEAIVNNSIIFVEQDEDILPYCLELTKTLEEFFQSTTLGQFSCRLRLVKIFAMTLESINPRNDRLHKVVECINAVYFHHKRYENHASQVLSTGRMELERSIREQIQLASWKDVNVQSLKESARRSHNKLFRTIKKYRALLAQPLDTLKASDPSGDMADALLQVERVSVTGDQLSYAAQELATYFEDWQNRPERLRDPVGASASIRKVYKSSGGPLSIHELLAEMATDIRTSSDELRKKTPTVLTEENASLSRHLRGQKRRLFTDTMKNVSDMGIRRNLGVGELNDQISTAAVLARSPDLSSFAGRASSQAANLAFHQLLDNMPDVRMAAREHSDDLSDGEVLRAVGLVEGMLSTLKLQRASLHRTSVDLQSLSTVVDLLNGMMSSSYDRLSLAIASNVERAGQVYQRGLWLCEILQVAIHVMNICSQYSGKQQSKAATTILNHRDKIMALLKHIANLPVLPPGLTSQEQDRATQDLEDSFEPLRNELKRVGIQEPEMAFVTSQLLPWLELPLNQTLRSNGHGYMNISRLDEEMRKTLDSIFVAMQKLASIRVPQSTEDHGWLVRSFQSFDDQLKALHISDVGNSMRGILQQLQYLDHQHLRPVLCLIVMATPIIEQYYRTASQSYERQLKIHLETSRLAVLLTTTFVSLAKEGFCTPSDPSQGQDQNSGKLEGGTGLGEGEGAEDISKDVADDEDLSELAQAETDQTEDRQEMDKSKDAVDMGPDDLNGETQSVDGSENESGDEDKSEGSSAEEDNIDEETGSVNELDPTAVDEKMWDDMKNEAENSERDMKSDKQQGNKTDDQTAKSDNAKEEKEEGDEFGEDPEENNTTDTEEDEEGGGKAETENVDPHLEEQEALDLPDDLEIGDGEGQKDDISDDGMDDLSDIDQGELPDTTDQVDTLSDGEDNPVQDVDGNDNVDDQEEEEGGQGQNEIMDDQPKDNEEDDAKDPSAREDDMSYDIEDNDAGESGQANQQHAQDEDQQENNVQGQNESEKVVEEQQSQSGKGSDQQQQGDAGIGSADRGAGREDDTTEKKDDALQKLADILDQFHQRREIMTSAEERKQGELDKDVDMDDADFEHLGDDDTADAQALGAANADQAQNIDQSKAIEDSGADANQDLPMPDDHEVDELTNEAESMAQRLNRLQAQNQQDQQEQAGGIMSDSQQARQQVDIFENEEAMDEDAASDLEERRGYSEETKVAASKPTSATDATELWTRCSTSTQSLSLMLTEQLRLILAPTTATKLRGDFRTGKRLNIKRIIPYIASGYKRDKIWMRRSIPSKRNYQVMIAVDDSKSMSESGADLLAFETVAMLSKSLSMLEVGELSVVNFGDEPHIRVAHPFGQPFSNPDSGINVFQHFSFAQQGTNVPNLVRESISLFQDARLRAGQSAGSSASDLWQLQLIVSDGHCSDHDTVRQLVRTARELKIMIVFVIVDAGQDSILDLKQAVFERTDPLDPSSEMTVKTKRYLDGFPFQYYVIVRDVADLPGVLARVLKGWFESVVDTQ